MNKIFTYIAAAVGILIIGFFALNAYIRHEELTPGAAPSYMDAIFTIDDAPVHIGEGGVSSFGNTAEGDLNDDGRSDTAFLITYDGGGSGTFYYAVVALKNADGTYTGTNAILLGDRVAPQTTEIHGQQLIVNFAGRGPDEPMTAAPHVGMSAYLHVADGQLVETLND